MKKKTPVLVRELRIWIRGRFTLTGEEKRWLLLILLLCWVGLLGRHLYLKTQKPHVIDIEEITGAPL